MSDIPPSAPIAPGKMRRVVGTIVGCLLMVGDYGLPFLLPKSALEFLGLATLAQDIRVWQGAVMWSLGHLVFWLPIGLALGLICWANWSHIQSKISSPIFRGAGVVCLIIASFFVPNFPITSESKPIASSSPNKNTVIFRNVTGGNGAIGIGVGGNNNDVTIDGFHGHNIDKGTEIKGQKNKVGIHDMTIDNDK